MSLQRSRTGAVFKREVHRDECSSKHASPRWIWQPLLERSGCVWMEAAPARRRDKTEGLLEVEVLLSGLVVVVEGGGERMRCRKRRERQSDGENEHLRWER